MPDQLDESLVCPECKTTFGERDYKCPACNWPLNEKKGPKCEQCGTPLRVVSRTIHHDHTFQYGQADPSSSRVRKQVVIYQCENGHVVRREIT